MDFSAFLLFQFVAHLLADYFFQTYNMAKDKNENGFKSSLLKWHILIVFATSWLLSFQLHFFIGAGIIAITHYFIDGLKPVLNRQKFIGPYTFFIDQFLHILLLILISYAYAQYHGLNFYWEPPITYQTLLIITAYLICLKPANIVIKEVLKASKIDVALAKDTLCVEATSTELPNAGKLIGVLERILALTFILVGEYQAVGFLIAAKSILRYKDTDTLKTEYVLIGTMLSFGFAVILGIYVTS